MSGNHELNIGFIGFGNMAQAIAEGLILKGAAAADRIYGMLPQQQKEEYRALWEEFEAMETPEAKFVNALDKVQPLMLNHASGGISWREHGIHKDQVLARNARTCEGSETLWEYAKHLIEENVKNGNLAE